MNSFFYLDNINYYDITFDIDDVMCNRVECETIKCRKHSSDPGPHKYWRDLEKDFNNITSDFTKFVVFKVNIDG